MKRLAVTLAILVALFATSATAFAQQPEFKLGFKTLADQIPDIVGQPLEDEHYGANGDSLQRTTRGLMAWRKADNWTAFTNGHMTWVNGPLGLQTRFNDQRFCWEGDADQAQCAGRPSSDLVAAAPAPPVPPTPTPPVAPADTVVWSVDRPAPGAAVSGQITVSGWAVDRNAQHLAWNGIDDLQVYLDAPMDGGGRRVDTGRSQFARPDVATALGNQAFANSGFSTTVSLAGVAQGPHSLYVYVKSQISGWRSQRIDVVVQDLPFSTASLEPAMLRGSDLPSWYSLYYTEWLSDNVLRSEFRGGPLWNSPVIVVVLNATDSPTVAATNYEGTGMVLATDGFQRQAVSLSGASASAGFINYQRVTLREDDDDDGDERTYLEVDARITFVIGNVIGNVRVYGPEHVTHMSQSIEYAQKVVNHLRGQ